MDRNIDTIVAQYIETMLWADGEQMAELAYDGAMLGEGDLYVSDNTRVFITAMVTHFVMKNDCYMDGMSDSDIGHNLYLSSMGHGAGFFDSGHKHADVLQRAARQFQTDFHVDNDGEVCI